MSKEPNDEKQFVRHLRRASTPAEELLWFLVRKRQRCNMKFRRQHRIGIYVADFYCTETRLIVECDGARHFNDEGIQRDSIRTDFLNRQGYDVIRFTSHENETLLVLESIDNAMTQSRKTASAPHPPAPSPRSTEEKGR